MQPNLSVQKLQSDVTRKIHGNVSESFFGSLNEAARWFLAAVDPYEMKRKAYIEDALYDDESTYYLPVDVKDNKIIDIRKQKKRTYRDAFDSVSNRTFDKYNSTGNGWGALRSYTIISLDGIKYIRIKDNLQNTTLNVQQANNLTNNGTWNVYGSVNNLTLDQVNFLKGDGALQFDINTGTSGALEVTGMSSVNISDYMQVGALFVSMYLPDPQNMVSVTLKWGSSPTDYWAFTVMAPHNSPDFVIGWNQLKFPLEGFQTFGAPNPSDINLLRLEFQSVGAPMYGVHINNIVARKGVLYEMLYYSSHLFKDPISGLWKPETYDLGDLINLGLTSYNILMLKTAIIEAQEVRNSSTDVQLLNAELDLAMKNYLASNKSEYIPPTETWYKSTDPTRAQFYQFGGIW